MVKDFQVTMKSYSKGCNYIVSSPKCIYFRATYFTSCITNSWKGILIEKVKLSVFVTSSWDTGKKKGGGRGNTVKCTLMYREKW